MHYCPRLPIFWASYPLSFLTTGCRLEDGHAPSFHRMAHGPQHGLRSVGHLVGDGMGDAVGRNSLPVCLLRTAGARLVCIPVMAQASVLYKDANGLRALDLKPASLLRTAQASLPVPRSHRAPAGQGQKQNPGGGDLRTGLRALGLTPSPKMPRLRSRARLASYSFASLSHTQAASRARFALDQAPHPSRLGTLPLLSLVGTRSCFCRDRISQRWGASFSLLRLGASHHGPPALGGLRKLSLMGSEEFLPLPSIDKQSAFSFISTTYNNLRGKRMGCGRSPNQTQDIEGTFDQSPSQHHSIQNQTVNKE